MKKIPIKITAIGAVCAALSCIFLTAGYYLHFGEFIFYLLASLPAMALLYYDSKIGFALSFAAACAVTLITTGFGYIYILPYFMLFGHYPLTCWLFTRSGMKKRIATVLKLIIFEVGLVLTWRFTELFTVENEMLRRYMLPILLVVGVVVFFMYDEVIRRLEIMSARLMRKLDGNK
ncbi:MAG TPA: hypothetical protein PLT66_01020 [Bacillota bacterium]|nr:hypothetical protein [Bacillota bacterium]